jgi:putative ABC transport system permease protein
MTPRIPYIIYRSLRFYKKPVLYQVIIIALLSAVITGSLLTGYSVRESLRKSSLQHLGNADIVISSGVRYFDPLLVQRMKESSGITCTGIIELNGYCQGINSQKAALNTHIFGLSKDFFAFQGYDTINIRPGEIAINSKLAEYLGIKVGEDLIIRFKKVSDISPDAPFASSGDAGKSIVMKIGSIINPSQNGNFSLSISQITPLNIFINQADLEDDQSVRLKINRVLVNNKKMFNSVEEVSEILKKNLIPADLGLRLRITAKTGENELISDRIFIDNEMINEVARHLPSSSAVITYLGNRFISKTGSTPYSFVSALPASLYHDIPDGNGMIINRWMAADLSVKEGDSLKMYWFSPDSLNNLVERNSSFIVKRIEEMKGIWSDSLLMPEFPGISGKESCSEWDAGVNVKMSEIRSKDENYWKRYRGTPKAFINYEKGQELWGNNFGPATSIRFPKELTSYEIEKKLSGFLDPGILGLTITDLSGESLKAANEGVDFATLFLSLGFFLILASLVMLSFAASSYFNSKKENVNTLFKIGFKNRSIAGLLYFETVAINLIGCLTGAFAGYLVNVLITGALNTVWSGAVQTDTLGAYFDSGTVISGFVLTLTVSMVFMYFKVRRYLKMLNRNKKEYHDRPNQTLNLVALISLAVVTISLLVSSLLLPEKQMIFSFSSGVTLLITIILLVRQKIAGKSAGRSARLRNYKYISRKYYSVYISNAVTPVLFIAAGIFSLFITGANRMNFNEGQLKRSGGTGGYLFWCENTIPLKEDLNKDSDRRSLGLDEDQFKDMNFVQMKRSAGDDASCLNLNHISVPPLLGVDPSRFIANKSFSFSKVLGPNNFEDPWQYLKLPPEKNTIYGIADQTVLEWGLKLKPGDTLVLGAENGRRLSIIIAAGLQSSVFQGNVLIGQENFSKYFPTVSGTAVFLVDGNPAKTELIRKELNDRLGNYGINIETTAERLSSFYEVTNTYLSVFGVFGAFGMIIGVGGLGFVLLRNYNNRKNEFALMLATGFHLNMIKRMLVIEQLRILIAGVTAGIISAIVATYPSIFASPDIPWLFLGIMVLLIVLTGLGAILVSVRTISAHSLILSLKKE